MPPKVKITREMVLDAAFALVRESGFESLNVRTIAGRLGCSTQPVLYSFATMDGLRSEVRALAERFQDEYIESSQGAPPTITAIGMAYIRFAAEEKHLFRLLFQSDHFARQTLSDVVDDPSVQPLIGLIAERYKISRAEARDSFTARFLMVHGMASMLANNSMEYDAGTVRRLLELQFGKEEGENLL